MEPELYIEILENFEQLFEAKENCDVIIHSGEGLNQKKIFAHSVILRCQSNYFRAAFSSNWAERNDGTYILKKPNIFPHIFEIILRYLYCGQVDLRFEDGLDILKLFDATDELGLNSFNEYIQEYLINVRKKFLQKDPIKILEAIFQHETCLKDYYLEIICQEPDILFGTDKLLELPGKILEALLKREDLTLDEIEIWNNLIRWVHAQHPTIDYDTSKWSNDDIVLMENTLSRFIPLIRFHDITSKQYFDKVLPYQNILPERFRNEIWQFYLVSDIKQVGSLPSRSFLSSVIINPKHLELFAGWLDKKDEALKSVPYKFNLLLRGSRDKFDAKTFHARCDDKGATFVIARIKGMNQMVGGYNPLDWKDDGIGSKRTPDSFIFSFENYNDVSTGRIGRVIQEKHAIRCFMDYGPIFGEYKNNSNDIMMDEDEWTSNANSYPNIGIPSRFEIQDYEVFQVVKKTH